MHERRERHGLGVWKILGLNMGLGFRIFVKIKKLKKIVYAVINNVHTNYAALLTSEG